MKKTILTIIVAALAAVSLSSCGPGAERGAVAGGLLGAGTGAIIGHQSGRGLEGAGIGAVAGALAGGALGDANDQERSRRGYDRRRYDDDDNRYRRGGADPEAEYEEGYRAGRNGAPYGY